VYRGPSGVCRHTKGELQNAEEAKPKGKKWGWLFNTSGPAKGGGEDLSSLYRAGGSVALVSEAPGGEKKPKIFCEHLREGAAKRVPQFTRLGDVSHKKSLRKRRKTRDRRKKGQLNFINQASISVGSPGVTTIHPAFFGRKCRHAGEWREIGDGRGSTAYIHLKSITWRPRLTMLA